MQHASQYACNGSATTGYNNSNVCTTRRSRSRPASSTSTRAHENHSDERDNSDSDVRRAIPDRHLDLRRRTVRAEHAGAVVDDDRALREHPLLI